MPNFFLIIFLILFSINMNANELIHISECPNGFIPYNISIYNPITKITEEFYCQMENRLDFYKVNESNIEIITSIYPRKDTDEKSEDYQFNHYREYYSENKRKKVIKFTQNGEISREERFNEEGTTIYRYLKEANKIEEFDTEEKIIRKCSQDIETGVIVDKNLKDSSVGKITLTYNPTAENKINIVNTSNQRTILKSITDGTHSKGKVIIHSKPSGIEHCDLLDTEKYLKGNFKLLRKEILITDEKNVSLEQIKKIIIDDKSEIAKYFFEIHSIKKDLELDPRP